MVFPPWECLLIPCGWSCSLSIWSIGNCSRIWWRKFITMLALSHFYSSTRSTSAWLGRLVPISWLVPCCNGLVSHSVGIGRGRSSGLWESFRVGKSSPTTRNLIISHSAARCLCSLRVLWSHWWMQIVPYSCSCATATPGLLWGTINLARKCRPHCISLMAHLVPRPGYKLLTSGCLRSSSTKKCLILPQYSLSLWLWGPLVISVTAWAWINTGSTMWRTYPSP